MSPLKKLLNFLKSPERKTSEPAPAVYRKKLDVSPQLLKLVGQLQRAGYETYIVGGAVRDMLLDRVPKDYDVSTAATPEEVREVFGRRQARIIGKRFRLVHVHIGNGDIVEVSTFRRTPKTPGRIPAPLRKRSGTLPEKLIFDDNEFGNASQDAARRDFTANALFYDPFSFEIKDFNGMGLEDIRTRTVRAIGDPGERFEEDPVRLLRALKLVGQFGFELEENTRRALEEKIHLIAHAAPSRLALELEKILKSTSSDGILAAFHRYGMLRYILPELEKIYDSPEGEYVFSLLKTRNRRVAEGRYKSSISIPMAILALPILEKISGRAPGELWEYGRFPTEELADAVRKAVSPHAMMHCLTDMAAGALRLQPMLRSGRVRARLNPALRQHAEELLMILNDTVWHSPELAAGPVVSAAAGVDPRPRRRRRHSRRRGCGRGGEAEMPIPAAGEEAGNE